jgi:hypothetical protein
MYFSLHTPKIDEQAIIITYSHQLRDGPSHDLKKETEVIISNSAF